MKDYILAVDMGTTSTKAFALLTDGTVLAHHQKGYTTSYPKPDYAEQDPDEVFAAVLEVISQTVGKTGNDRLIGISFSCAMHSLMAVNKEDAPISPLIIWADARSTKQAERLKTSPEGKKLYQQTGTPLHPMSPLCKLLWMKEENPELFSKAHRFISIKEYVFVRLLGQYIVDYSIASATGLFDNQTLTWSPDALKILGLDVSKLSKPVSPYHISKGLKESYARQLKISDQVPFIAGGNDGCLAHLGSEAMGRGELTVTIGTSGAVRMATTQFRPDEQGRIFNYRLDENIYITGGATNNGAVLISWFAENIEKTKPDPFAFDEEAFSVSDTMGLIFLPYLLGERAPINDPLARGVFFGISMRHKRAHFKRALLEGICFELRSIMHAVEEVVVPVERVMASGGFVKSDRLVQLLCDIMGKPILVKTKGDASSLGAALVGYQALGIKTDFLEPDEKLFQPDPERIGYYEKRFAIWDSLYGKLKDEFVSLSKL